VKAHRLRTQVDFVEVQIAARPHREPRTIREDARSLMVHMRIDGPLSEDDVRLLGGDELSESRRTVFVDHGRAVDLPGEQRLSADNLACRFTFGRAAS
jgi:hypothetical protein